MILYISCIYITHISDSDSEILLKTMICRGEMERK